MALLAHEMHEYSFLRLGLGGYELCKYAKNYSKARYLWEGPWAVVSRAQQGH